jgi:hypothetical protein
MRTLLKSFFPLGLFAIAGCANLGDVIELRAQLNQTSGQVERLQRETKASLELIEERERQMQQDLKATQDNVAKVLEAMKTKPPTAGSPQLGEALRRFKNIIKETGQFGGAIRDVLTAEEKELRDILSSLEGVLKELDTPRENSGEKAP